MDKSFLALAAVMLLAINSFSQKYEANWQKTPVKVDGISSEWTTPLRFSDTKSGLQYNVTNDADNLYICVRATDVKVQKQIMMSGMKIMIDENGKKKYATSINFPMAFSRENIKPDKNMQKPDKQSGERPSMKGGQQKDMQKEMQKQFKSQDQKIALAGFKSQYNGTYNTSESQSVKAALDWDDKNVMTCEFVIPINSFCIKGLKNQKGMPEFSMKIEANALEMAGDANSQGGQRLEGGPPDGGQMGDRPEGMGGGQGGPPGGGMGERPSAPSGQMSATQEDISIKYKIKLSDRK